MCVFLGYLLYVKGYKVLDLDTHDTFISRDVIFHEDVFPFMYTPSTLDTSNVLPHAMPMRDLPDVSIHTYSNPSPAPSIGPSTI